MKKTALIITLLLVLILGAFGVKKKLQKSNEFQSLRIGIMNWAGFYPIIYALNFGIINPQGIELINCKDNSDINDRLIKGEIDLGFGAFADHVLIRGGGSSIRVIYLSDYSKTDSLVVGSKIKAIKDLKGKTIGIEDTNSFSEFFIYSILSENQFQDGDVYYKIIPFDKIIENIEKGNIVAGHTWEPEISKAKKMGMKVITSAAEYPGIVTDTLAARTSVIETQKERIQDLIVGIMKATEILSKKPEVGADVISQFFSIPESEVIERMKGDVDLADYDKNLKAFSQTEGWAALSWQAKKIAEFYSNRGQLIQNTDQVELLDPQFLNNKGMKP